MCTFVIYAAAASSVTEVKTRAGVDVPGQEDGNVLHVTPETENRTAEMKDSSDDSFNVI